MLEFPRQEGNLTKKPTQRKWREMKVGCLRAMIERKVQKDQWGAFLSHQLQINSASLLPCRQHQAKFQLIHEQNDLKSTHYSPISLCSYTDTVAGWHCARTN